MNQKGILTPFAFITFFLIFMIVTTTFMAGMGFTGVSNEGEFSTTCDDAIDCGSSFYDNIVYLLTFQSNFELFNIALGIAYMVLIVAVIGLIAGGV